MLTATAAPSTARVRSLRGRLSSKPILGRVPAKSTDPVAIIGASGALGFGLALRLARAGVPIAIGSRDPGAPRKPPSARARHVPGGVVLRRTRTPARRAAPRR